MASFAWRIEEKRVGGSVSAQLMSQVPSGQGDLDLEEAGGAVRRGRKVVRQLGRALDRVDAVLLSVLVEDFSVTEGKRACANSPSSMSSPSPWAYRSGPSSNSPSQGKKA